MILFPIFLVLRDCGEVELFASISDLQRHLEPIDVENDEYDAWDARGTRLRLTCRPPVWLGLEPAGEANISELRSVLVNFARQKGRRVPNNVMDLDPQAIFEHIAAEASSK